jgi:hypothetical protein
MIECDEFKELHEENSTFTLKKGTILYSGNTMKGEIISLKDIFEYVGQRGKKVDVKTFVLYATTNFDTAYGYARSCLFKEGYVHKFKVMKDVVLLKGDIFEDAELIDKCVCSTYKGYAVIYSSKFDEFALCNSPNYLKYMETLKCLDKQWVDIEGLAEDGISALDLSEITN